MSLIEFNFSLDKIWNQISTWAMRKSDFFFIVSATTISQIFCLVNSYRNTISEWAVVFRYENFFILRVEKSSKISPWAKNLGLPSAVGLLEARGWRNFHTWKPAHSEILYLVYMLLLWKIFYSSVAALHFAWPCLEQFPNCWLQHKTVLLSTTAISRLKIFL